MREAHRSKVKVRMSKKTCFQGLDIVCLTCDLEVKGHGVKVKDHWVKVKCHMGQGQIKPAANNS